MPSRFAVTFCRMWYSKPAFISKNMCIIIFYNFTILPFLSVFIHNQHFLNRKCPGHHHLFSLQNRPHFYRKFPFTNPVYQNNYTTISLKGEWLVVCLCVFFNLFVLKCVDFNMMMTRVMVDCCYNKGNLYATHACIIILSLP